MLFNSNEFLVFFCLFFFFYFLLSRSFRAQNVLVVVSSFLFYGRWSLPFLALLIFTGTVDYLLARQLQAARTNLQKRLLLAASIILNLAILGYFKYGGFALQIADNWFASQTSASLIWTVVLPVGISFYTFQSISYVVDVYRGTITAERNWITFMSFLTFFPQLVAGPIERASHLLPQFQRPRETSEPHFDEGTWLVLWGLFKKVVIADNLARYSDLAFGSGDFPPAVYLLGTLSFGVQIYCDFSGYSDIARGLGKFFGFDIMFNFRVPYAATNLREFWARWHVSLSGWFRDYVYIPLGGNRGPLWKTCRNLLLVMLLAGLWHGANWTFILWGLWHGAALVISLLWRRLNIALPGALSWLLTMSVIFFGWLFFRATSLEQLYAMFFVNADAPHPLWLRDFVWAVLAFIAPLAAVELVHHLRNNLTWPQDLSFLSKSLLYGLLFSAILFFWENEGTAFIYFQF